jgi:hypothetical protein
MSQASQAQQVYRLPTERPDRSLWSSTGIRVSLNTVEQSSESASDNAWVFTSVQPANDSWDRSPTELAAAFSVDQYSCIGQH